MAFLLEEEEADGEEKFKNIKNKNRRILSQMAEVNGALAQTFEKVIKKQQNETNAESAVNVAQRSVIYAQLTESLPIQAKTVLQRRELV